ncbi:hypothetical protein ACLB2K_011004 [Fragaria x ananassa]
MVMKLVIRLLQEQKKRCVEKMYGSECDSFSMLSWFREAVLETNPGSSVVLEVDESTERFKRVFVAYAGQIQGFKFSLPVLYIDGVFGKSKYKGQILAATGRNGNKGRIITFISNRGVGLLKTFDLIFPGNPHLYCYHHLRYNLSRKYKNKGGEIVVADVLQKFFKVAYASTEKSFYFHLKNLRDKGGAATIDEFIREIPLEHWCRAFFKGCRYGIMANGIAESFNNWIVAERSLPPFVMLDHTRMKEMKMMLERSVESKSWTTKLTPKMEKRLKEQLDRSRVFRVIASHENVYEVRNDKYSYSVDLSTRTCSCMKWQINCFPCAHALAAIQGARLDVYDFIDPYFTAEHYRMCYSFPIAPLSNVDASCSSTEDFILPPVTKRPAGRPKSKRIPSAGEKKLIRCGRCNKMGHHNKKSCTEPLNMLL